MAAMSIYHEIFGPQIETDTYGDALLPVARMDIPPDEVVLKEFNGLFLEHSYGQHPFVQLQAKIFVQ
jgi:hypothetical protein